MLTVFVLKVKSQKTEEDLHCYFKEINFSVTFLGPQYSCQIFSSSTNTKYSISKLFGQHTSNLTNNDVMQFVMDYTISTYLPTNLYNFLPNLKLLAVRSSSVEFIEKVNFEGFKNIQFLSLSDNNMETIPSDTFSDLATVMMINLHKNLLTTLHKDLFKNNIMLKTLKLEANRITILKSDMFDHLKNIKLIDLSNNLCLNRMYSNSTVSHIQKSVKNDLDNECSLNERIQASSTGITSNVKYIIIIVMIIVVLILFIEFTCFIHKLKATNKVL